ncbi:carbohydrate ABC transporter permease [Paenibacillus aquistagni]|uniref:ABC-type glycerol-3-phosphate transport system, permease component n=1 Tax=Paenibacillus aquistagni TaxID=1852522 RepID=A0A1X7LVW1_9BACL|nr:carbohydrate ABC transporter permease [Paenibacillus aquistagni]NMM52216.1 carbohydrate ABC transporter permease [Paenibacillus aquistagni]SMG58028.1 ABC-type glycerol-3-phosphate transport system, permease component [Paenibacillus aquistagni]
MKGISIRSKRVNRSWLMDIFLFLLLGLVAVFMALPLVFTISNAFKPLDEIFIFPPRFLVRNPTFDNFRNLVILFADTWVPFSRYVFNTFFIAILGTVGHVIIASAAAYPLAKVRFPGRNILFSLVVMALMFTPYVTQVPNYMTVTWLGMVDTYWAVILPAFGMTLGLYLMKQFMEQIPDALIEAAKVDGASEYRIFWQIVMPIVKPAWLTLIIFSLQNLWTGNSAATRFIYSEQLKTVDAAFSQIAAGGLVRTGPVAAVTLLMMLVPITVFIVTQSNIIQTMSTSGIKE